MSGGYPPAFGCAANGRCLDAPVQGQQGGERVGPSDHGVLDRQARPLEHGAHRPLGLGRASRPRAHRQGERDGSGRGTLGRVEEDVAAGQRHAIGVADGRAGHDVDRQTELVRHRADHGELLPVLFPEHGRGGSKQIEQPRHHLAHPCEVPRATRVLQTWVDRGLGQERNGHHLVRRIDVLRLGREDRGGPRRFGEGDIRVEGAGISLEVARVVELRRVDEDADAAAASQ
ncbi:hypothetical protein J4558_24845 [Leptolyngbya sp. 15MV]|nr:hypothetical protein J4558_24845 [Leptolyngbya sp. 15MV]